MKVLFYSSIFFGITLVSCSSHKPSDASFSVSDFQPKAPPTPIDQGVIKRLPSRLESLPRNRPIKVSEVLSHLGLWQYRQRVYSTRKSVFLYLPFNESDGISILADEKLRVMTNSDVTDPHISEWDNYIHSYKARRVRYNGTTIELNVDNKSEKPTPHR